jgi:hypothetical protein
VVFKVDLKGGLPGTVTLLTLEKWNSVIEKRQ